jgi:hypothetical protein
MMTKVRWRRDGTRRYIPRIALRLLQAHLTALERYRDAVANLV